MLVVRPSKIKMSFCEKVRWYAAKAEKPTAESLKTGKLSQIKIILKIEINESFVENSGKKYVYTNS